MEQAIGAVTGHEIEHAVNKSEIHKDIKYEMEHKGKSRPESQREIVPERIEQKIIEESKLINEK